MNELSCLILIFLSLIPMQLGGDIGLQKPCLQHHLSLFLASLLRVSKVCFETVWALTRFFLHSCLKARSVECSHWYLQSWGQEWQGRSTSANIPKYYPATIETWLLFLILYTSHRVYAFIIHELMTLKLTSPASSPPLTSGFLYPTDMFTWKSNKQLQLNKTKKGPLFSCPHPHVMFLLFPSQQMAPPFTQLHKPETQDSTFESSFPSIPASI